MRAGGAIPLLLLLALSACRGEGTQRTPPRSRPAESSAQFEDTTARARLDFRHFTGARGEKYLPETLGSGVCAFDYDGDHRTDLYFVNGAPLPSGRADSVPTNHLFRNRGDGTFEDVTAASGTGDTGYGIGCAAGDYDSDGRTDLYVANFGADVLYRNRGDGTFENATSALGAGDASFSTAATFVDVDSDGDLDLYVVNYLEYRTETNKYCGEMKPGYRAYCGPDVYGGSANRLYRNDGNGRFTDISSASGAGNPEGKGLGVVAFDCDDDGDEDLYVANDGMASFLYRNDGRGRFQEVGLLSGVALSEEGTARSGMGVDAGDFDGDGRPDLFIANLSFQSSSLYRNNGDGTFSERGLTAGIAGPTHLLTGYGAAFVDFDNDGALDLFQANGSMMDNVGLYFDNVTYREPAQLFRNRGDGTFEEVAGRIAPALAVPRVGRGSAVLDYDGDGNLDLVLVAAGSEARLFRNRGVPGRHFLRVLLQGTRSNRDGFGARLRLGAGGKVWTREAKAASGYASQSEGVVHFGLGSRSALDWLEVRWPDGTVDRVERPPVDRLVRVLEGSGRAESITPGR
jgi:enediyne biosynthesis protein E4